MRLLCLYSLIVLFVVACTDNRDELLQTADQAITVGDVAAAQATYQRLASTNKYDVDAIKGMAVCSLLSGATQEAERWSRELLKYRPWDRDANLTVGKQAAEHGDFAEAANRLLLAFIDSEFKLEKEEVKTELLNLHRRIAAETITKATSHD